MDTDYLYRPFGFFGRTYRISDQQKDELAHFLRHWYTVRTINILVFFGLFVVPVMLETKTMIAQVIFVTALYVMSILLLFAYYAIRLRRALVGTPLSELPLLPIEIGLATVASIPRPQLVFVATGLAIYAILTIYISLNGFWPQYAANIRRFATLGPIEQIDHVAVIVGFAMFLILLIKMARTIRLKRMSRSGA